jgi:hypothetical protein
MSDQPNEPDYILLSEPLTPMRQMALEAAKLLKEYVRSGFTRKEAMELVLSQLPEWNFPSPEYIEDDDDDELWEEDPQELSLEDDDSDD